VQVGMPIKEGPNSIITLSAYTMAEAGFILKLNVFNALKIVFDVVKVPEFTTVARFLRGTQIITS
jgi:hypothetical protein